MLSIKGLKSFSYIQILHIIADLSYQKKYSSAALIPHSNFTNAFVT